LICAPVFSAGDLALGCRKGTLHANCQGSNCSSFSHPLIPDDGLDLQTASSMASNQGFDESYVASDASPEIANPSFKGKLHEKLMRAFDQGPPKYVCTQDLEGRFIAEIDITVYNKRLAVKGDASTQKKASEQSAAKKALAFLSEMFLNAANGTDESPEVSSVGESCTEASHRDPD